MNKMSEEIDWFGKWLTDGVVRFLVEPSNEYKVFTESEQEVSPEPTQEEYMMDMDYRLSLIELGL